MKGHVTIACVRLFFCLMHRVSERVRVSRGHLVVPPFDCAWLSDADSKLDNERGCVVFEVSGETDATIILQSKPGSRRLPLQTSTESNGRYVIVFGSHRNSRLSIERNEDRQATVRESWAQISPDCFRKFWMCYVSGVMYFGTGDPSMSYQYRWEDTNPLHNIHFVGLSAWDKHCTFRNVRVLPCLPWLEIHQHIPSLFDISTSFLSRHMDLHAACQVMLILDRLQMPSNVGELWKKAVSVVAHDFETFLVHNRDAFCQMSSDAVCALLKSPALVRSSLLLAVMAPLDDHHRICEVRWLTCLCWQSLDESSVFHAVVSWMFYGRPSNHIHAIRPPNEIKNVIKWIRFTTIETEELQAPTTPRSRLGALTSVSVPLQVMLDAARQMDSVELSGAIQNALVVQSFASGSAVGLTAENVGMSGNEISPGQLDIDMFWTRSARNGVQLQYYYDGDKKGVVNYLAHSCGQKPWRNPMLNKKLLVKTSSPPSRSTSPKANMPLL